MAAALTVKLYNTPNQHFTQTGAQDKRYARLNLMSEEHYTLVLTERPNSFSSLKKRRKTLFSHVRVRVNLDTALL